jgi:7-cyano-7-deazaguanine reductase
MSKLDNTEISKVLGQRVDAPKQYDKSILVREKRANNREYLNIKDDNLPFIGIDIWNNWEISALTDTGLPVTGIAKITYPCSSKYIVESKSAKLYFNSFNMSRFGKTPADVIKNIENASSKDLSDFLETDVVVKIFTAAKHPSTDSDVFFKTFKNIDLINSKLVTETYNETPSLLKTINTEDNIGVAINQRYCSSLLRSNCRVTNQPDAGDVYISITTKHNIDPESLLKYIISFRNECHFHEEICECFYARLKEVYEAEELFVGCFYVRRGSLDINPVRASSESMIPWFLKTPETPFFKMPRQ